MKRALAALALSLIVSPIAASASDTSDGKVLFQGTDISPAVRYYSQYVATIKTPFVIYNWSTNGGLPFWKTERPSDDPALVGAARHLTQTFWKRYGEREGMNNMYGAGLYGAADPVLTVDYGGGRYGEWLLLQMRIPAGFKMLDLARYDLYSKIALPSEVSSVLNAFKCPVSPDPSHFFSMGGSQLIPSCQELVRKLFKDTIQIDGFAYSYGRSYFKECDLSDYAASMPRAFVIIKPDWVRSDLIRFYTRESKLDEANRIEIQTLFFKAREGQLDMTENARATLVEYLISHPTSSVKSSTSKCSGSQCILTVRFCDPNSKCEDVDLPPLPRLGGAIITEAEAKTTQYGALLWRDLEGKPKAATISTWIKENTFACTGVLPYPDLNITDNKKSEKR